jgi:ABC-type transport system substrate-binding protein
MLKRVLLIVLALAFLAPVLSDAGAPRSGGTLKFALLRDPTHWDPHIYQGATTFSFMSLIYESLVRYTKDGAHEPGLAARWEIPNPTTYILHLRQGVKFHSGNPFTSEDVKYTIARILDPKSGATRTREFGIIQDVTAVNPFTVRITLKKADAPFLELLASNEAVIVDKKWAEGGGNFRQQCSGTGPFKQGPFETGVRYTLVKNPDYWEKPYPYLDRIEYASIPKDDVRVQAVQTGNVDMAEYIPWQAIAGLKKDPKIKLTVRYDTYNFIRFNPKRPPFDNPKVRQAFNYLIDRKEIIDLAWGGIGEPITAALIPEGHWAYPNLQVWKYDPTKGKQLLAEAGVNPATTKILFDSTTLTVHMDSAQIIVTQLQKAGFSQIELKPMDVPTQQKKRASGDYQMFMDGTGLPWPDPDFYTSFFGSDGGSYAKAVGFSDAKLDQLLDEGRTTLDQAKRKAIYAQIEQRIVDLAPWVWINWRPQAEAAAAHVHGFFQFPGALAGKSLMNLKYIWKE